MGNLAGMTPADNGKETEMDATDAVIEKIKKAIRLANKTTEAGERETAMRLAKSLAEKNGLSIGEIIDDTTDTGKQKKVETDWVYGQGVIDGHSCVILKEHFGVVCMMTMRGAKRKFTYFGNAINIDIAKYVFDILHREAAKAWREASDETAELGFKLNKGSFMNGWFYRIHKKLTDHPLRNDLKAESEAARKAFEEYQEQSCGKVKPMNVRGRTDDDASLYRGYMVADRVSLNRPVNGGGAGTPEVGRQMMIGVR